MIVLIYGISFMLQSIESDYYVAIEEARADASTHVYRERCFSRYI